MIGISICRRAQSTRFFATTIIIYEMKLWLRRHRIAIIRITHIFMKMLNLISLNNELKLKQKWKGTDIILCIRMGCHFCESAIRNCSGNQNGSVCCDICDHDIVATPGIANGGFYIMSWDGKWRVVRMRTLPRQSINSMQNHSAATCWVFKVDRWMKLE